VLEGVVSAADDVDPELKQLVGDLRIDAPSTGRVLSVHYHVVEREFAAGSRDRRPHRFAADVADDISKEEQSHCFVRF
jgi:hypothetical protein